MSLARTESQPILPTHALAPGLHAGFWLRFVAYVIDALILGAAKWSLLAAFGVGFFAPGRMFAYTYTGNSPHVPLLLGVGSGQIVVVWLYYALCEASRWQATPGKLALGLRVTDLHGERIGFGRATGRYFGKFISGMTLLVGYMLAGWTERKQALHDLLAGCCVVRKTGLEAWRQRDPESAAGASSFVPPPARGMPGWAIALIVAAVGVLVVLPLAAVIGAAVIAAQHGATVRAQVGQGVAATTRARTLVAKYIARRGALPVDNAALGLPPPHALQARYVSSVRVTTGQVVVTYGDDAVTTIRGAQVVMSPEGTPARLRWRCSSPDIRADYLPEGCRR